MDRRDHQRHQELQQEAIGQVAQSCPKGRSDHLRRAFPAWAQPVHDYGDSEHLHDQGMQGVDDFAKPKIVWAVLARTGNAFIYDEAGFTMPNTTYLIASDDRSKLKFLIGILNSKVILRYLDWISAKLDETGWRWFKQYVELFPIPVSTPAQQKPFIALVDRILAANAHTDTSAFESQIDALVYRLYSLSSEEIAVVEGCK